MSGGFSLVPKLEFSVPAAQAIRGAYEMQVPRLWS